jgi:choline dehydrogenase-like flavoprotein
MAEYDPVAHGDMDIIFAGGGTAACVAAGRLARANPDLRILLIERGGVNIEDPNIRRPALFRSHLEPGSKTAIVSL